MNPDRADEPQPEVQEFLQMMESQDLPPLHELSVVQHRRLNEQMGQEISIELENVEDRYIDGPVIDVPIRIYDPRDSKTGDSPVLLFFHGGGFIAGSIETHDLLARKLAKETGCPVVSVDYRLAPENPFPAGLEDCYSALEWLSEAATDLRVDPEKIVVTGDSAGGTLAAATSLLSRDRDGPDIAYQVLLYPSLGNAEETEAYEQNAEGFFLTADFVEVAFNYYTKSDIIDGNKYAWPCEAKDLSGLPPATIITAGFDPLRDDGALYGEELEASGIPVQHHHYNDMIHAFMDFISEPIDVETAHHAYRKISEDIQNMV